MQDQEQRMQLAVNAAMSEYRVRSSREALVGAGGSSDTKRPKSWCEFGFPEKVSFADFLRLYRRGAISHGAVNKLIGTCWRTMPEVVEGEPTGEDRQETAWERSLKPLMRRGKFWRALREADRRRLVGRYSALVLKFSGEQPWSSPVKSGSLLLEMTPTWQSALEPKARDQFGNVTQWTYRGSDNSETEIHPDRVFLLGDTSKDAVGFLEAAYNNLVSIEKVEGGSGESFLKNAARQMAVNFNTDVDLNNIAAMYGVELDELHERFNDAARELNRANDLLLITQGATATSLVSEVPDPRPTYSVNLQSAACALDIPSRILIGNEQGERASTEDRAYFNQRCNERRNDLSVEISELLDHLMALGAVEHRDEFCIVWDDLTESSPSDKLENGKRMAEINASSFGSGAQTFSNDEIRVASGYEPAKFEKALPDDTSYED